MWDFLFRCRKKFIFRLRKALISFWRCATWTTRGHRELSYGKYLTAFDTTRSWMRLQSYRFNAQKANQMSHFSLWIQLTERFKTSASHSLEAFAHRLSMNQNSQNVKPHLRHNIQWMTRAWLATCPVLSVSIRCVCCWFKRVVCTLAYLNSHLFSQNPFTCSSSLFTCFPFISCQDF